MYQTEYKDIICHHFEFADFINACAGIEHTKFDTTPRDFNAFVSFDKAVEYGRVGFDAIMPRVQTILSKIDDTVELPDIRGYAWMPNTTGAYVSVPAYLSSAPNPMRNRRKVIKETAPIKIYVTSLFPAWCSVEQLLTRYSAILAYLMLIESVRPVDLYLVGSMRLEGQEINGRIPVIHMPSKPIQLSLAAFTMHPSFVRQLVFTYGEARMKVPSYIPLLRHREDDIMAALNLDAEDIYLPMVDREDILMTEPEAWVKGMIDCAVTGKPIKSLGWSAVMNREV